MTAEQNSNQAAALNEVEKELETAAETLRHCIIVMEDYHQVDAQQDVLRRKINETLRSFQRLHELEPSAASLSVPLDALKFLDEGKNPDQFTKELMNLCNQRNQHTNGKLVALEMMRQELEKAGAPPPSSSSSKP